jgi:hypothetical protein
MHESMQLLKLYAPTLFECANRSKGTVARISAKYEQRWDSMAKAIKANGAFEAMTCIFSLLWEASENTKAAREFLSFIDQTVRQSLASTTGSAQKQLEKLVVTMMITFDEERSEYRNHFAEIAVISKLLTQGNCKLESIEKQLPNGKRMDFEISKDGIRNLIEVYNINFNREKLHGDDDLIKFLENRLVKKIVDKIEGIENLEVGCQFVPVLWGDIMSLVNFIDAFEYFKQVKIVTPFMMVAQYTHQVDGRITYDFGSVEQFLLRVKRRNEGTL